MWSLTLLLYVFSSVFRASRLAYRTSQEIYRMTSRSPFNNTRDGRERDPTNKQTNNKAACREKSTVSEGVSVGRPGLAIDGLVST